MTDLRRPANPLWIESATPEELAEVEAMDRRIAKLAEESGYLRHKRMVLTNRCCQRSIARRKANGEEA